MFADSCIPGQRVSQLEGSASSFFFFLAPSSALALKFKNEPHNVIMLFLFIMYIVCIKLEGPSCFRASYFFVLKRNG